MAQVNRGNNDGCLSARCGWEPTDGSDPMNVTFVPARWAIPLKLTSRVGTATRNHRNFASLLLAGVVALAAGRGIPAARADTPARYVAEQSFVDENNAAMTKMMTGMAIKPTGDIDRDFVVTMVPHHQGAIDMAQAELRYGDNQQLIRISQEIIAGQLQEIAAMHVALGEKVSAFEAMLAGGVSQGSGAVPSTARQPVTEEAVFLHENAVAMDRMMAAMTFKPTGNIDRDFVTMMVPHHQGAIDLAQAELRHGHNASLRRVAQEIIVDETEQITLMRLAVNEALPEPAPSPTKPARTVAAPEHGNAAPMSMQMSPLPSTTNRSLRP
jgi:uncharacterized protein (DUF305 family)